MTQWQLKVLTQAELASAGVAFYGPWPPPSIKPVPTADVTLSVVQKVHRARHSLLHQRHTEAQLVSRFLRGEAVKLT